MNEVIEEKKDKMNIFARHLIVVLCLYLLCERLSAQGIDVQYNGTTNLLSLDDEIFVNSSRLKKSAAVIISSNRSIIKVSQVMAHLYNLT